LSRKRKDQSGGGRPVSSAAAEKPGLLRIIGGSMRGRKLAVSGDPRTRPMKDRVREAVFNLVGPSIRGQHAIDLFAGTGALGLEAISRGAQRATLVEHHLPTSELVRANAAHLGVADRCEVVWANTFFWARTHPLAAAESWVVFCSPPYAFYLERQAEMLLLIETLLERAPGGSTLVVESDSTFDPALLPQAAAWVVRSYPPAVVAIFRKP
jgi:16S rRNA (guanine966-N2)-methyltransferase